MANVLFEFDCAIIFSNTCKSRAYALIFFTRNSPFVEPRISIIKKKSEQSTLAFSVLAVSVGKLFSRVKSFCFAKKNNSARRWPVCYTVCHVLNRHSRQFLKQLFLKSSRRRGRPIISSCLTEDGDGAQSWTFITTFRETVDMKDDNLLNNKTLNRTPRLIV